MKFGVCGEPDVAAMALRAFYDFVEGAVDKVLMPQQSLETFRAALAERRAAGVNYPVVNCFIPADRKITGPEADLEALRAFVEVVLLRAEEAGADTIVFGSGGARKVPEGFDGRVAWEQLVAFCSMVAPIAADHGVTVVVEPLNQAECNVLTTIAETASLVREVSHPSLRLLVDAYHLMKDGDRFEDIVAHADLLAHAHIATVPNRRAPGAEDCDFTGFFAALHAAGYCGRLSVESRITDPDKELPQALSVMRALAAC